mmetsp:Transcript_86500/g.264686  ORF Transcript_86500/g.264686 Transcript_86500/m.264686 type:complete len:213 (+) Transcript_86500:431-1069(+)
MAERTAWVCRGGDMPVVSAMKLSSCPMALRRSGAMTASNRLKSSATATSGGMSSSSAVASAAEESEGRMLVHGEPPPASLRTPEVCDLSSCFFFASIARSCVGIWFLMCESRYWLKRGYQTSSSRTWLFMSALRRALSSSLRANSSSNSSCLRAKLSSRLAITPCMLMGWLRLTSDSSSFAAASFCWAAAVLVFCSACDVCICRNTRRKSST